MAASASKIAHILSAFEGELLTDWRDEQRAASSDPAYLDDPEFLRLSAAFSQAVRKAADQKDLEDVEAEVWSEAKSVLAEISRAWALQGFSAAETATFVLSFKKALFKQLGAGHGDDAAGLAADVWLATSVFDALAVFTTTEFQRSREEVIARQNRELLELSTPVVELWEGILVLPLIGTLDSIRTQMVMEALLQKIVETDGSTAIIDITGVPAVDTLVAQHLLKTVAAARLMGADCLISGISPQIAQTIVHLGVDLSDVMTKASLADAFAVALRKRDLTVAPTSRA